MAIFSFANTKGGSGKTTSALIVAGELARRSSVIIIDADPRQPLIAWSELAPIPASLTVRASKGEAYILDEIDKAAAEADHVIIDLEALPHVS